MAVSTGAVVKILSLLVEANDALSIVSGVAAEDISRFGFSCRVVWRECSAGPEAIKELEPANLGLSRDLEGGRASSLRRSGLDIGVE